MLPKCVVAEQNLNYKNMLTQGEILLAEGQLNNALLLFNNAYEQIKDSTDETGKVVVMSALGEGYQRAQQLKSAEQWLIKSYKLAETLNQPDLLAAVANRLGNFSLLQGNQKLAHRWYQKTIQLGGNALKATAHINIVKVEQTTETINKHLSTAYQIIEKHPDIKHKSRLLTSLGYQAMLNKQTHLAYSALQKALAQTKEPRIKSQALGYLAKLYFIQHKYDDAFLLLEQAIIADNSPDLLMNWSWQKARLLKLKNDKKNAIKSYRQAVDYLLSIKSDIPILYQDGKSSFSQTLSPLYMGLIDLLLQQSKTEQNEIKNQQLLQESQQIWEKFKTAELQDFFKNSCVVTQNNKKTWHKIEKNTAVLYPILLPDRLEILVGFDTSIKQYTVPINKEEVAYMVNSILDTLNYVNTTSSNKRLHDLLIKPIQQLLDDKNIKTIVYLPDGPLRKLPLGLLKDDKHYLIEKYAIATIPGLSMLTPEVKLNNRKNVLLAGMSVPGPVIYEFMDLVELKSKKRLTEVDKLLLNDQQLRALSSATTIDEEDLKSQGMEKQYRASQYTTELTLPNVTTELNAISTLMNAHLMENQDFKLVDFEAEIIKGFSAIHIATHGLFSGDPDKSFIMTYDRLLKMNKLATLFQTEAFADFPVDLVSLSACSTAEGDDRSPLGLSGLVVQMGVKSVIGTLWPVADNVARMLFTKFYQFYRQPEISKASALRLAKLEVMKNKEFSDPFFWAPFILIGHP